MKTNEFSEYVSPELEILLVKTESGMCASIESYEEDIEYFGFH